MFSIPASAVVFTATTATGASEEEVEVLETLEGDPEDGSKDGSAVDVCDGHKKKAPSHFMRSISKSMLCPRFVIFYRATYLATYAAILYSLTAFHRVFFATVDPG